MRIASLPALAKTARRMAHPAHGAVRWTAHEGGFETRPYVPRVPVQTPVIDNCQLSIVNCHNLRL
ncbi:MAG: hypothetical protein LBM98_01990 [Oscillospiraceae bacterium]|nr:hypothetical protein [Oscillospiraceae bacterium]